MGLDGVVVATLRQRHWQWHDFDYGLVPVGDWDPTLDRHWTAIGTAFEQGGTVSKTWRSTRVARWVGCSLGQYFQYSWEVEFDLELGPDF